MAYENCQGGRLHNCSGQPVPMLSHRHSKKVFPDVRREPPAFQFVPTASGPVTGHHRKEASSLLFAHSLQVFTHVEEISVCDGCAQPLPSLSLLFSRLNWPRSQPFLTEESFSHLCSPLLDSPQYVHVFLVLGSPVLDTALQVRPHQCWIKGQDHLPRPAGNTPSNAAQDATSLSFSQGHIAGLVSTCSPRATLAPFLQSCCPDGWLPVCNGAQDFSSPGAGLCTSLCWTLWGFCQGPSRWQHNPLAYRPLLPLCVIWELAELTSFNVQKHWLSKRSISGGNKFLRSWMGHLNNSATDKKLIRITANS